MTLDKDSPPDRATCWSARYGEKHRLQRIESFPVGIVPPKKIRLYYRTDHFVLQWWDPAAKKNLSDRVDGDLIDAIVRARQIEERLELHRSGGRGHRKLDHAQLVQRFADDLRRRVDAEEIDPGTVCRYQSALRHYLEFAEQPHIQGEFPYAARANRQFQLAFAGFLSNRSISSNGHPNTPPRPMRGQGFVEDTVRAMFEWAMDPERGNLLPDGFRNPFLRTKGRRRETATDQLGEPDITVDMAVQFIQACDQRQLALFAPLILYGLRASEPCYVFREYIDDEWFRVKCCAELHYQTKGRRDKRFPMLSCVHDLVKPLLSERPHGLLYQRLSGAANNTAPSLFAASMPELTRQFQERCAAAGRINAPEKRHIRDELLKHAGALFYDDIEAGFKKTAKQLNWPKKATLKDFRHLFSTCLENAGMPEHYRKYLMGHSSGRAAIVTYTHLNKIRHHFDQAISTELEPIASAVFRRIMELITPLDKPAAA